jgi:cytochrome c-type biogenesis protein CcmH/NrfF
VTPLAHAGHWLLSMLYVLPVAVVVLGLAWQTWRERRRGVDPDAELEAEHAELEAEHDAEADARLGA